MIHTVRSGQVLVKIIGIQVRSGQVFSSIRSISGHLQVNFRSISGNFWSGPENYLNDLN